MKVLGMIGGVGPESTIDYYRLIQAEYRKRKPDGGYPGIIINSVNLQEMIDLLEANDLPALTRRILEEIGKLVRAEADFGLLSSNTPHIVFDDIQKQSPIPLISIVETTCQEAKSLALKKIGLFGSGFTMRARFYPDVFAREGIALVMPNPEEQNYIHRKYMDEFVKGIFRPEVRDELIKIVDRLKGREGIDGLILGGTELPLILRDSDGCGIPFLDTTQIHVNAAVAELLS
ncbi:MAG TPA: amino acid racemase [Terriglobales bacterium]|nr:amino acid racemase [Terriglobales bacterium]